MAVKEIDNIIFFLHKRGLTQYINNSIHMARKYARIFVRGHIICSKKRKTVCFGEQIISKDKYPSIYPRQMKAIEFIILQTLFATHVALEIGEYHSDIPQFGRIFSKGWFPLAHKHKHKLIYAVRCW